MYVYEDIPMLLELITKHPDENLNVLVENEVLDSSIVTMPLFFSHHHMEVDLRAVFNTISFLRKKHGYDRSLDDLYKLIGILSERLYVEGVDAFNILESYMNMYLIKAYICIIDREDDITLRDIFKLYGINPISITETKDEKKRILEDK